MNNEFNADLITLISDDGQEIEFEILDIIENDEGKFYVLYPFYENPADAVNDPGEYYIMEVFEKDGEEELAEIEDDEKLDRIAAIFEENYYSEEDEENMLDLAFGVEKTSRLGCQIIMTDALDGLVVRLPRKS